MKRQQLEHEDPQHRRSDVERPAEPGSLAALEPGPERGKHQHQRRQVQREAVPASLLEPGVEPEVGQHREPEQHEEQRRDAAQPDRAGAQRQPARPAAPQRQRDLQLPVRHGPLAEELVRRSLRRDSQARLVEQDQQEQRQQQDAAQPERHADRPMLAPVQRERRGAEPGER